MSKIYEALLQAEQDRRAAESSGLLATPQDAASPAAQPITQTADRAVVVQPVALQAVTAQPTVTTTAQTGATVLDPSLFRASAWNPQLALLPAVSERGRVIEQFRNLRSRLYELRDQKPLKSILIVSGLPQEGKSYVAINLAISLARNKASRVLLIDGDMRRSSLHKVLGCERNPGLTNFLAGTASVLDVLQRPLPAETNTPLPSGLGSLTFLAGGDESDKAADLSSNRRFGELIAAVAPSFDWIIVDSSPVNLVSDGINLSRACDGSLLIVRDSVTRLETAQRALNELRASRPLGVVLNAAENLPSIGGYYGYDSVDTLRA
jgi:protein-tyrosine kinase